MTVSIISVTLYVLTSICQLLVILDINTVLTLMLMNFFSPSACKNIIDFVKSISFYGNLLF